MNKTNSPIVDAARETVLSWYTGKGREKASAALDLLAASEAQGCWVPKASRTVRATLCKANRAINLGRNFRNKLDVIGDYKVDGSKRGHKISHILQFGNFWGYGVVDYAAIRASCTDVATAHVVDECERFVNDFATITQLLSALDATRPIPTITYLGASPTVTKLLQSLGLAETVTTTIRLCPVEWITVTRTDKDGRVSYVKVGRLVWPEGIVHGASRYGQDRSFSQCQACGHAIKNPWNWVPLIVDNAAGVPHSLWVGTDCARTLFGVKVTGDFEIERT